MSCSLLGEELARVLRIDTSQLEFVDCAGLAARLALAQRTRAAGHRFEPCAARPGERNDPRLDMGLAQRERERERERERDRDAMAAVDDVAAVRALDHTDRRQRAAIPVGVGDAAPAPLEAVGGRPEVRVEVACGFDRADDRRKRSVRSRSGSADHASVASSARGRRGSERRRPSARAICPAR